MVGHPWIMEATIKACKVCVQDICEIATANNYAGMMLADHGNAEYKY